MFVVSHHTLSLYIAHISLYVYVIWLFSFSQTNNVSVGKMDIVWRSRFGERGRIQTGQLKAVVSDDNVITDFLFFRIRTVETEV